MLNGLTTPNKWAQGNFWRWWICLLPWLLWIHWHAYMSNSPTVYIKYLQFFNITTQCCCCPVTKSCLTLHDPMDHSTPGFPVPHRLPSLPKLMSIESGISSNPLILCHPLLLLPSIFPSTRLFSNESAVCIRWLKYWSFSFSISPFKEYSGLISFKMDWFDLLAFQGTLKSLL